MISSLHTPAAAKTPCQSDLRRRQARRRQVFTLLFALVLISVAGLASAQSPQAGCDTCQGTPLALDGVVSLPAETVGGGAVPQNAGARPAYVRLNAELASWDSDADPDGWRAQVILLDREDRPVIRRANATFELIPRIALQGGEFVDAQTKVIRWSMPLEINERAVAEVKLPLRQSLRPMLEWSRLTDPSHGRRSKWDSDRQTIPSDPRRTFVIRDVRDAIARPTHGALRVRVSVPTEGTFDAVSAVRIRPPVLVDTPWPYR